LLGALKRLALDGGIARAAAALVGVDRVRLFLDQILYKQPGARPTRPHADAPYLAFDDSRSVNCWIAIDAAGPSNGAMQYYAGSHVIGRTRLVHLDREDDDLVADEPRLAACPLETVVCQPGDAVFHSSGIVHRAFANLADTPRRAFSIQYMPDGATYNGWSHPFLAPYRPRAGDVLDYDCLPLVHPASPES
jgi:ectoine hydroxylase-related dioxygenase (phytanoyl-CoA dioxygenase family)